ncbi:MAG: imidazole glycerol phosphate synthase subunit HisF [Chitinivibrionia bacterium]|nr:imidazole glycerol phosphate synthase subunit HisF [Chitinivibrionia bacterium]
MCKKRIIACLDVKDGKLVKGVKFVDTKEIGDPVERAKEYMKQGLDELVFYDITATSDNKDIMIDLIKRVAEQTTIPFSVGGGIKSVEDCKKVIAAGAQKVNINSAAVKNPQLVSDCVKEFGSERVVLAMDVKQVEKSDKIPTGYEVVIDGGRTFTGIDAIEWAKRGEKLGAGELVVNSIDADGTKDGYDISLTKQIVEAVSIPVVASGGAGKPEHLAEVLTVANAATALVATMVHFGEYTVSGLKKYLAEQGIKLQNPSEN